MPSPEISAAALKLAVRRTVKPMLGPAVPVSLQRVFIDNLSAYALPGARVTRHAEVVGGVPVSSQTAADVAPGATVLYFHGGGYVTGSPRGYGALTSRLARAARARVLSVDYRLAPEHPFPAAFDDACAAYAGLLADGQDPSRLTVAGDSAGGGLALACVLSARDRGLAPPGALIMFSPWLDLRLTELPAGEQERSDPMLSRAGLDRWAELYCAEHTRDDPRCSPGLSRDLSGLPPTLIQYDVDEILAGDSVRFGARARSVGAQVELEPHHGLWHVFELFTQLPQARSAIRRAGAFAATG